MGIQQAMVGGGGIVNPLLGGTATPIGVTLGSQVAVLADGRLGVGESAGYVYQNWYLPTTTGVGDGFYVKFTVTGTTIGNDAADWTQINATREVTGFGSVLVEIASDAGGTAVVTSGTYTLENS